MNFKCPECGGAGVFPVDHRILCGVGCGWYSSIDDYLKFLESLVEEAYREGWKDAIGDEIGDYALFEELQEEGWEESDTRKKVM